MPSSRIWEIMSPVVESVAEDMPGAQIAARMRDRRVSCLVVKDGDQLKGIISERDVTRLCADVLHGGSPGCARDIMSPLPHTIRAQETGARAMELLREHQIRRLVVVDEDDRVSGVVTQSDLLKAHSEEIEAHKAQLERRVRERTEALAQANERLAALALRDPLLGIGNRRAMDDELIRQDERYRRYGRPYSVALLDVDYFKKFNDLYGHPRADDVLQQLATTIQSTVRAADSCYRYGGEELLVVYPEIGEDGARVAAEHVRGAIEALGIPHEASPFGCVTVSVGVAGDLRRATTWTELLHNADEALYEAKNAGRNRVV